MRRGVLTAGTWCLDLNKSIPVWPSEDTMTTIAQVDRQGGGSACNMAIDLKRLDPVFPVETMGLIGDDGEGRFLIAECDRYAIGRSGLKLAADGATPVSDCFNVLASGRRTHFFAPGVAAKMSPADFDFSHSGAKLLHLGLPGAHATMDAPWGEDTTGWATVLRKARAAGLKTNLEMVTTGRDEVARFGRSCLPHLDLLIVNDYEIGCVAGLDARAGGQTSGLAVAKALKAALEMGPLELAVAHFPEGAIAATRSGEVVAVGSVAMEPAEIAGVNGAGDAFAAGVVYGWHEGWALEDALRLGHASAAASMREVSTTRGVTRTAEALALAERHGFRPKPI
jgi:sugar/nucleoside kinase (ribokinase family)